MVQCWTPKGRKYDLLLGAWTGSGSAWVQPSREKSAERWMLSSKVRHVNQSSCSSNTKGKKRIWMLLLKICKSKTYIYLLNFLRNVQPGSAQTRWNLSYKEVQEAEEIHIKHSLYARLLNSSKCFRVPVWGKARHQECFHNVLIMFWVFIWSKRTSSLNSKHEETLNSVSRILFINLSGFHEWSLIYMKIKLRFIGWRDFLKMLLKICWSFYI